jgi:hypothetical protein
MLRRRKVSLSHTMDYPPSTASMHPIWGDRYVTGSVSDGWVRVHDASSGREMEVHKGHHGPVHAISFVSPFVSATEPLCKFLIPAMRSRVLMESYTPRGPRTVLFDYGRRCLTRATDYGDTTGSRTKQRRPPLRSNSVYRVSPE